MCICIDVFFLGGLGARIYGIFARSVQTSRRTKKQFLVGRRLFIEDGAAVEAEEVSIYLYVYTGCIYL